MRERRAAERRQARMPERRAVGKGGRDGGASAGRWEKSAGTEARVAGDFDAVASRPAVGAVVVSRLFSVGAKRL
jgi:hypothetical protein